MLSAMWTTDTIQLALIKRFYSLKGEKIFYGG